MDPWRSRAVIIHRDENGYGLTVSGDNPVSVQTIKPGGAAELAGIREGDIIIKVNGTVVESMNHTEVVTLIRAAGPYVTLTVRPPDMISMPGVGLIGGNGARPHHMQTPNERVTAPLPVNQDVQLQMQGSKLRTLQAMRDKAAADVEMLWKKFEVSQNPRDHSDFEKAQQGLKKIECQMKTFRQSSPNLQLHTPAPFNPSPQSHHSVSFQPFPGAYLPGQPLHQQQSPSQQSNLSPVSSGSVGGNGIGPNRNRNPLSAQSSVPTYLNTGPSHRPLQWGEFNNSTDVPPPLPPRSYSQSHSVDHPSYHPQPPPGYASHDPMPIGGYNVHGQFISSNASPTNNHSGHGHKNYQLATGNNDVLNNKSPNSSLSSGQSHHSQQQTHHRTKSSPDPVSMQKALNSSAEASRRSDSVSDLSKNINSRSRSSVAWDSVDSNRLSPPGSPPPPYGKHHESENNVFNEENHSYNNVNYSTSDFSPTKLGGALSTRPNALSAVDIISMEEDDGLFSREVVNASSVSGKHGPYSSLSKLLEHNAHLAVFMNYVINNRWDPSSLLFYLLTGLYIEEGNIKEMKRWGYEIHSTFTAPGSPLLVPHVDENIAAEIDDALVNEFDKEEMMRRVFRKARNRAKEEINKQLEEFCNKKIAGLGSMFGPPDSQLDESLTDKNKELWIVETYLQPRLLQLLDDWEQKNDDRTLAIVSGVSTVLQKQFNVRNPSLHSVIERCSSFVSKEKSMRSKFMSKNKKVTFNGHHFTPQYYYSYTECNICCKLLWGVGPQGFQCIDCNVNIHRHCTNQIQDNCLGSSQKKDKANDKFRKFKEKIRPEKDPKRRSSSNWSMRKYAEETLANHLGAGDSEQGDRPLANSGSSSSNLKNDRRPDTLSEERLANDGFTYEDEDVDHCHQEPRRSSNAVGRSESCKERVQRKQTRERRKHSDPNLTSKSSDVDLDNQRHLSDANNSGSSSNSSLSARSLDSPSTSLELVAPSNHSSSSLPGRNSETPETTVGHSGVSDSYKPSPVWEGDSDIEIEQDPPDWTKNVPEETLSQLDKLEKKRQEVLNELFHTERSHVRNLKVVDQLFLRPIRVQQLLPPELIQMLFANLDEMLIIHGQFNAALKKKRAESPLVGDIGPVLLEMFDGDRGENFKQAAATFCSRQQIGLEALKERRRKDPKFKAFLSEAESEPVCRRLGIKDMIPMAMQRLTKYPLLFDNLCDCTAPDSVEYKSIQRAVDMSKEILCSVNLAKKEAEDLERLTEIQRRLDKSSFEKGVDRNDASSHELRNLDFTRHKLIYEGPLMWRMTKANKQKSDQHDVHAVLLQDMVVLLLKQDDRLVLKIHNVGFPGKTEKIVARPIIKITNLIHRPVATDKKAFFLISTTSSNMYELVCSTAEERKIWLQHITKAADDFKSRQQESRRPELHPNPNIPPAVPEPEDRTRENEAGEAAPSGDGSAENDSTTVGHEPSGVSPNSQNKDSSPAPDNASILPNSNTEASTSPESARNAGDGKLGVETKRSVPPSPNPSRLQQGEFRVTESSPLIDPSEVVVATRDVQFAQPVISPHGLPPLHPIITKSTSASSVVANKDFLTKPSSSSSTTIPAAGGASASPAVAQKTALATSLSTSSSTDSNATCLSLNNTNQTGDVHAVGIPTSSARNENLPPLDISSTEKSDSEKSENSEQDDNSPCKELKRADSLLHKAFEDKLKIVSKILHIPLENSEEENSANYTPKDTKELVVACMHQVGQLGRLFANQKITNETLPVHREQLAIHKSLNNLLTQLLSEVHRRDDDLELRRQELHRVREQNHGYQERLQTRAKVERQPSPGNLSSPTLSPTQSRPNSFLSVSSSSDQHEFHQDDEPVMMKAPLKPQLSAPVATSSSNSTRPQPVNSSAATATAEASTSIQNSVSTKTEGSHHYNSASDLAQEEFADAVEDLVTTESDSSLETNRESTETEVSLNKKALSCIENSDGKNGESNGEQDELKTLTAKSSTSTLNENEVPDGQVTKKDSEDEDAGESAKKKNGTGELTNGHHQTMGNTTGTECENVCVKDANCLENPAKEEKLDLEQTTGGKKAEVESNLKENSSESN